MHIYFWLIRLAALLGHPKARKLVQGQAAALRELKDFAATLVPGEKVTWIHVSSVGEFEQARPIIESADAHLGKVVLTFFSPSGYELRKNYNRVAKVTYLPFATRRNARKFLSILPVQQAIFVKYEFWPAYLKALRKNAIPTILISAIFRPTQLFFMPWGGAYRNLLKTFQQIFVQDEASKQLLEKFHIGPVQVAGDTRFDRVTEVMQQAKELPMVEAFATNRQKVLVAGSTWLEDEKLLARYVQERKDVALVLVPHEIHPTHLHQIFQLLQGRFVRYTEAKSLTIHCCETLLVDTIGVLSSIYRYGHVAYIGGGFGDGIHNTLEAAVYGMPVVFGPKWQHFREARGLIQAGAAQSIHSYQELAQALDRAFEQRETIGAAAAQYVQSECGATSLIIHYLNS